MKLLKIRVRAEENTGKMLYPAGFTTIKCLEHKYCDDIANNICWLVVAIDDKDLDKIKDMTDVTEVSKTDAGTFLEKYDPQVTEITDEGMVRAIEIKAKLGTALTATELKALDPADPTLGINYAKRFIDKVNERTSITP